MEKMQAEKLDTIARDVSYIRGQVDTIVGPHETRISSLESCVRNHNILGMFLAGALGVVAWLQGTFRGN